MPFGLGAFHEFQPDEFDAWCRTYLAEVDHSHKESQSFYLDGDLQFVGRFEALEADMRALVAALVRVDARFERYREKLFPRCNSTGLSKAVLMDRISPSTQRFLYEVFREDFERLGYDPELARPSSVLSGRGERPGPADAKPVLTVLITYYNYGAYLEACLQSVYAAACADFRLEVLLVDDCSASEHRAVLDGLRKRYPELKVLWNACNLGLARSRNAGLQAASGDYVFILDADNTIEVDCLHRHFQAMQADPALVACYAPVQSIDSAGRRLDYLRSNAPFSLGELRQGNYIDAAAPAPGFSEACSVRALPLYQSGRLSFDWPRPLQLRYLRFDPLNVATSITLKTVTFYHGDAVLELGYQLSSNANCVDGPFYDFDTSDPQIRIDLNDSSGCLMDRIEIDLSYARIGRA